MEQTLPAVVAPVEPTVRPAAWIQHHKAGDNLEWEDPGGKRTPLYTLADLQAAVAAAIHGSQAAQDDAYVCGRNDERKAIAEWLEGQGQPGYAHEVRFRA